MRKNLQHLKLKPIYSPKNSVETEFINAEGIAIKNNYNIEDIDNLNHIGFGAGFTPFLRGSNAVIDVKKPWKIFQNTAFASAENNNTYYKKQLTSEQRELFITLNSTTLYDSDGGNLTENIDNTGVIIESVEDMKTLFNQIPLSKVNVSIPVNSNFLPLFAFYILTAIDQGIDLKLLNGNFIKDISREFTTSENNIYSSSLLEKIVSDIAEYTAKYIPNFNHSCISGNQLQYMGATADIELAYTLSYGLDYIREKLAKGKKIDIIAANLSFSLSTGMDYFMEIAKMRSARMLWAKLLSDFNPTNSNSTAMNIHCQTSINNLEKQNTLSNITRKSIEASASVFGGTQSLYINSLKGEDSELINRNIQVLLQEETKITKTIDPWAGSFLVEKLTDEITYKAWNLIEEIEQYGGMSKFIESGNAQQKLEQSLANKQERLEHGIDKFVKSNKQLLEKKDTCSSLESDSQLLLDKQLKRLELIKDNRDNLIVKKYLDRIKNCVETDNDNLLELTIEAAKNGATLREINNSLR